MISLKNIRSALSRINKSILIALTLVFLIAPTAYASYQKIQSQKVEKQISNNVLGVGQLASPKPSFSPSTSTAPLPSPQTAKKPTSSASLSPAPSPSPNQSAQSLPKTSLSPTPTPSGQPSSQTTPSPTLSPSSSPQTAQIQITIDYTGASERNPDSYSLPYTENQTAWEYIKNAIGIENLQYTDYGGDLGIFITGINGVSAAGNQFWEFKINGQSASVGISSYIVNSSDALSFVITTF